MRLSVLLFAMAVGLLVMPGAHSSHYYGECRDWTLYVPADAETRTYPGYFVFDEWYDTPIPIHWIYAESNGVTGIQRADAYCYHVDEDGNPYTEQTADFLIW